MKIGLFGGSFNPIHKCHIKYVKEILKKKLVDEIWIIPVRNHASKGKSKTNKHRIKMIELAIKNLKNVKLKEIELIANGKNYTYKTLKQLKALYDHEFFLIIGSDLTNEFTKWKNYKYLLNNAKFIIGRRKTFSIKKIKGMKIKSIISFNSSISSTKIRDLVSKNRSFKHLVPKKIYSYIIERGIYSNGIQ